MVSLSSRAQCVLRFTGGDARSALVVGLVECIPANLALPNTPMAKDCLLFRLFHLVRVRSDLPKLRHRRIARFYLCSSS